MLTFIIIYFVEDENGQSTNFSPHSKQFSPIVRALLEKNNSLEIKAFPFRGSKIPPTLQQLKDLIRYSCHQMVNYDDDFELMYLDNDGDKVAMRTDSELQLAWNEMQTGTMKFELYVHLL